jgi:hypothetical protein
MFVRCVCCQVEVSATSWSLVQRSPTDCGASLCVINKPCERKGHSLSWAAEPEKIIIIIKVVTLNSNLNSKHSIRRQVETWTLQDNTGTVMKYVNTCTLIYTFLNCKITWTLYKNFQLLNHKFKYERKHLV